MKNWEVLEEYAGDKQGFYQVLGDVEAVEIRVAIGRLGFKKEFESFFTFSFCSVSLLVKHW
ncbi:MAG: hypothetical protein QMD23_05945, partial [Candidatus Bathyarchaeia archaeon]|nr:hypothetical protein [Candidatus Bathyarchaeia archaeon]